MLEGLIATLMNRFLGMYIKNFDSKQLNVGIWSGDVKLRNLELKKEALDQMKLPLNVSEGHLGELTLSIPWSNLKGKPVKVLIEDVYLLAAPKADQEYDEEEEERRQQDLKHERLKNAELLQERSSAGMSDEEQQKNQSFTATLTTKILDNLQITVKNIHIRYEDAISTPGHPFALGITLAEFSAVSTNRDWKPEFIQGDPEVTHKLARLESLAIYWNTDSVHLVDGSKSHYDIVHSFKDLIASGDNISVNHQFILRPVSGAGRIEMNKTSRLDRPKVKSYLAFEEIGFVFDDDQYRDLLKMEALFHSYARQRQYRKYRPKHVSLQQDPKAWLKYAADSVLSRVHDKNEKWSWGYFKERRDNRKLYIQLFKQQRKQEPMSTENAEKLKDLEWKLTYEDLRFYRSLARNQLRKERSFVKKPEQHQPQGWVSWIWGSEQKQQDDNVGMTEQQRKELYDAIDWDERQAIVEAVDIPRETVKLEVQADLDTGSFTLKRQPHDCDKEIMSLLFDRFHASYFDRPDSFAVNFALGGLRLYDGTTEGSLYQQIIRVKDESSRVKSGGVVESDHTQPESSGAQFIAKEAPFFEASFEDHPLDGSTASALTVRMRSMEIIYNPRFVEEIYRFFKPPESTESIGRIMEQASATVEGIRQQTRAGLEFILEEHKTINAKLDLQAPLIIIPEDCTKESTNCLILDAGHISLTSDLVPEDDMRKIQAKQKHQFSEEDYAELQSLMYDKFRLTLESTQVLIGPSVAETVAQLYVGSEAKQFHIVDRINIDLQLQISITPKDPSITKFKMTGHLPVLYASMSDTKYKAMMKIIDGAIPNFGDVRSGNVGTTREDANRQSKHVHEKFQRPTAFQFSGQKELLLDDHEDHEDDGEDTFQEAPDGTEREAIGYHQRIFEFKFTVDKLQGSLFRASSDSVNPDKELVSLVAERFELEVYTRPYELVAEVILQALNVEDLIDDDPSPDFRKIISSNANSDTNKQNPLVWTKYIQVRRDSPEFMTVYEGIEKNVDVKVSTINIVVTRKSLLTLLDFIITTFASAGTSSPDVTQESTASDLTIQNDGPKNDASKIRVKVDLDTIALILNNDGIRLATISLARADAGVFLMGSTMRLGAKLGNLSLIDDINEGAGQTSHFRQLVSIQGDDLADFRYETFDPDSSSYPGYKSSIFLRSGSVKVNFVEEPFRKIIEFAVKFGRMQALFNAARQAAMNQASQIQENAEQLHFDILVETPIIVFPRVSKNGDERDLLTAFLGELYAHNHFSPSQGPGNTVTANKITAGVRKTKLASRFHCDAGKIEELEMLDKVDFSFNMTYLEHTEAANRPDLEIEGSMSDLNVKLTQNQYKFIVGLSKSIPTIFPADPTDDSVEELTSEVTQPAEQAKMTLVRSVEHNESVHLRPELSNGPDAWTKLDMAFRVGSIGMELYSSEPNKAIDDLETASLSRASLNNTNIKLRMISDGSLESEVLVDSFDIRDNRKQETNKFKKVMSSTNNDGSQFMASVTLSGGAERSLVALLTIDSPRVIFALDYVFALRDFVTSGLDNDIDDDWTEAFEVSSESEDELSESQLPLNASSRERAESARKNTDEAGNDIVQGMSVAFRVNIVDSQIILIANPASSNSEAIVLSTKQVLVSQQHALTLQVDKVGMFLCRMDKFETSRLRILDDFTLKIAMDNRTLSTSHSVQGISVEVEPLVLRVSLRDILLAIQIVNKASEMSVSGKGFSSSAGEPARLRDLGCTGSRPLKKRTASGHGVSTAMTKGVKSVVTSRGAAAHHPASKKSSSVIRREELKADVDGIRVILIGDQHELPLLDLSVKRFTARMNDWSGDVGIQYFGGSPRLTGQQMSADLSIETFVNIYNFSKSAWEPFVEPWHIGFHMSKTPKPEKLAIELYSRKTLELTFTSQTIDLLSKAARFIQSDEDMLTKPRGAEAPYRICNQTGFQLNVWAATEATDDGISTAIKLQDGQTAPWRFEEWEKMRENLSPEGTTSGIIGIKLEDSTFESIKEIPISREGETLFILRPMKDNVLHRLLCEVHLGTDNVKYITFRSPLLVENNTQIPIELGILDSTGRNILRVYKILPGESQPAPVEAAYYQSLVIRPDAGFGYTWSERLFWRDILKRQTRMVNCKSDATSGAPPFCFQTHAAFRKNHLISSQYPFMKVRLSAPVEVQNLLPYDFKFRIYDKNTRKEWSNFLRKGGLSPVHVVELSDLILMNVEMQDTPFSASEFAIINSNNTEFDKEKTLVAKDSQGLELKLRLHYFLIPDGGGAFRVSIYSPYIILNKTGLNIQVKSKSLLQQAKVAAGQMSLGSGSSQKAAPYMFSYPNDDRQNRAVLKVGDSSWSRPQSFEAIGSVSDVVLPSASKQKEVHVGISVDEGEGKYKMTKVVTLTPRFILKSKLLEDIQVREPGSGASNIMTLKPGQLLPLHFLRAVQNKQLTLLFPGMNNRWSAPFNIAELGSVHIKMHKANQRQSLIRAEILAEKATVFLHLTMEIRNWPFSMRNESTQEFTFHQSNPNQEDDEDNEFKPIVYKLPPRSIMPYAWDFPAAKRKELVLVVGKQSRHVPLAEIGNLLPFKVDGAGPGSTPQRKIIDLNVVANGPTQALVLSNYKPSKSIYKPKSNASPTSLSGQGFEVKDEDSGVTFQVAVRFAGIGISLINRKLKELAYITFRDLEFKYNRSSLYEVYSIMIKWVQVDNQLYGGIFPIVLYPSVVPKTGREIDVHPSVHASCTIVTDESYGVTYIKYATLLIQQMTVEIDEDFIYALLDFTKIPGISWSQEEDGTLCDETLDIPEPKTQEAGQDLYFELLNIQPAQLDLSFLRTEVVNVEDKTSSHNPLMFLINILTMAVGNVNDAPLRLNALMLENARVSKAIIGQRLKTHYTQEVLYQIHKILGSADFLGNPVGLFTNISSGVVDIFYEPYQGFIMTDRPQDLGIGIAKGATMFVKKSVFGVTDSLSKFTGSISKGLAAATMDKQFQDRRRMTRSRNRPKHALYGVTAGANSFVNSFASGVGGLARKPIEGAEREGALGFFKGIGKGVVGLATKPAIGVFDLASNVTEGIRNTTTVFDQDGLDRVRLTRFIGRDGVVRPYSQREALGQFWLKQLDSGKYFNEEYIAHLELPEQDVAVMLTYTRIMLVKQKKLYCEWDVPLVELQTISMERTGIVLILRGNRQGPFIPTKDESSRKFLFKKIGLAVNTFNSTASVS